MEVVTQWGGHEGGVEGGQGDLVLAADVLVYFGVYMDLCMCECVWAGLSHV